LDSIESGRKGDETRTRGKEEWKEREEDLGVPSSSVGFSPIVSISSNSSSLQDVCG